VNTLFENRLPEKINCGNNFAYVVNDSSVFLHTEYKVLQSQAEGLFVKCMKMLYNGKIQFYYMVNDRRSLMDMLPTLDADNFITIVANLFSDIIEVKNNGFLTCQSIDISVAHIFVEPATYKVSLVYLPIGQRLFTDMPSFESQLRANFVKLIQSTSSLSSSKTMQLAENLMNGMISLENLHSKIRRAASIESRATIRGRNEIPHKNNEKLKLVATNSPAPFEIYVTKNEFILGKKQEMVDGTLSFNRMISRVHCKIIRQGNQYAVVDLGSANGTYLNKMRLQPNQPCPIKNGDRLRLANSEFQVSIE